MPGMNHLSGQLLGNDGLEPNSDPDIPPQRRPPVHTINTDFGLPNLPFYQYSHLLRDSTAERAAREARARDQGQRENQDRSTGHRNADNPRAAHIVRRHPRLNRDVGGRTEATNRQPTEREDSRLAGSASASANPAHNSARTAPAAVRYPMFPASLRTESVPHPPLGTPPDHPAWRAYYGQFRNELHFQQVRLCGKACCNGEKFRFQ